LSEYLVPMYNLQTQREKAGECEEADKVNTATTNTSIDDASTSASSIEDVYDDHRFPVTRIPLTYKDFCKNGYNVKVVDCFNKLKSMALKHNKKFHAKLLSEQEGLKLKKKSATKTKKSQSKTVEDGKTAKSAAEKGGTTGAKTVNTTDNRKSSKETASEELSLEKGNEEKRGATTTTSAPPIVVITQNPSAMVPLDHEGNVDFEYSGATMPSQNLPKSSFLQWLLHRQLIKETSTNIVDLDNYLCRPSESPIIGCYVGFIFTEDLVSKMSLSTLLDIMILRQFQKCGHKPLILVRDANDAKCTAVRSVLENFLTIEENFSVASTDASLVNLPNDDLTKISRVKVLDIFQFLSKQNYATSLTIEEFNVMVRAAERVMKLNLLRSLTILFGMQDDQTIPFAVACGLNCNEKLYQVARKPIEGDTGSLNVDDKSGVAYWQFWKGASDNDLWNYLAHYADIELNDIADLMNGNLEVAKIALANNATSILHGWDVVNGINLTKTNEAYSSEENDEILPIIAETEVRKSNNPTQKNGTHSSEEEDEILPLNAITKSRRRQNRGDDDDSSTGHKTVSSTGTNSLRRCKRNKAQSPKMTKTEKSVTFNVKCTCMSRLADKLVSLKFIKTPL